MLYFLPGAIWCPLKPPEVGLILAVLSMEFQKKEMRNVFNYTNVGSGIPQNTKYLFV